MKAVFFDLDGTLLDTVPDIRAALNGALSAYGCPTLSKEEVRAFIGNGAHKLVERALPAGDPRLEDVYDVFRRTYGVCTHELTRRYVGMTELLSRLKAAGMSLAVLTNKPQEAAVTAINEFYPSVFDFIGGEDGSFPVKPDPTLLYYCALILRVPLCDCVLVGDGETDALMARNAGIRFVGALWGYRSRQELAEAGAREFAENTAELGKILLGDEFSP